MSTTELSYDQHEVETLASDSTKHNELKTFIDEYWNGVDCEIDWSRTNVDEHGSSYRKIINAAIGGGNIIGLELLWKGMYSGDYLPYFNDDVYTAARSGKVNVFLYTFYSFMVGAIHDDPVPLYYNKLESISSELSAHVKCFFTNGNSILPISIFEDFEVPADSIDRDRFEMFTTKMDSIMAEVHSHPIVA